MNFFDNLYTLNEIAINNGADSNKLDSLTKLQNEKNIEKIKAKHSYLLKFLPYCNWYKLQGRNVLAMSAYQYDLYKDTGFLPDLTKYDYNPDTERLEHWQYINPLIFEINPDEGFEFASKIYDCDVWNLFLSGCARMDYYEGENVKLEQRIKYAIVEYMLKRPQFFTEEDFFDNPLLHKKYKKGGKVNGI